MGRIKLVGLCYSLSLCCCVVLSGSKYRQLPDIKIHAKAKDDGSYGR